MVASANTYAICFVYDIIRNLGLGMTFGAIFCRFTRVVLAILVKRNNDVRRKQQTGQLFSRGKSGNDSINGAETNMEASMITSTIGVSSPKKMLSPGSAGPTDSQKAKGQDMLNSRKKSLDPEKFDFRMIQNYFLIVLFSLALTIAIIFIEQTFQDNIQVNACFTSPFPSHDITMPNYILDAIFIAGLSGIAGYYLYAIQDTRETLGIREDIYFYLVFVVPLYSITLLWMNLIDRFYIPVSDVFPGSVWMILTMFGVQSIIVLKPVYNTFAEEKLLSGVDPQNKEDFQKILNSPGTFRLFLDFCLVEGHPENIVFVREMKDVYYKVRGLADSENVPERLRPVYKAVFHRYINRGSRLELPLPPTLLQSIREEFDSRDTLTIGCFNRAHSHILSILLTSSYPRFVEAFKAGKLSLSKMQKS